MLLTVFSVTLLEVGMNRCSVSLVWCFFGTGIVVSSQSASTFTSRFPNEAGQGRPLPDSDAVGSDEVDDVETDKEEDESDISEEADGELSLEEDDVDDEDEDVLE